METTQTLFNIAIALIGTLGGWVLKSLHQNVRDLQRADIELADKVHRIDVLVAGEYVKRDQLERMENALFMKLDRIEKKLDGKMDKE